MIKIEFTDGTGIKAQGDNAFPDRYADAMGEMWDNLTNLTWRNSTETENPHG